MCQISMNLYTSYFLQGYQVSAPDIISPSYHSNHSLVYRSHVPPLNQVDIPETPLPHNLSQADLFAEKQKAAKKDSIMKRLMPGTEGTTTI